MNLQPEGNEKGSSLQEWNIYRRLWILLNL